MTLYIYYKPILFLFLVANEVEFEVAMGSRLDEVPNPIDSM